MNSAKEEYKSVLDYKYIDNVKILQTILSQRLQPEHLNPIINLVYSSRPSATQKERETIRVN